MGLVGVKDSGYDGSIELQRQDGTGSGSTYAGSSSSSSSEQCSVCLSSAMSSSSSSDEEDLVLGRFKRRIKGFGAKASYKLDKRTYEGFEGMSPLSRPLLFDSVPPRLVRCARNLVCIHANIDFLWEQSVRRLVSSFCILYSIFGYM
ncbi:hypothetical protein GWI33_011877 [Rhynchophorus ferrugineus]|uniref:Uncharacterized protein n=1 Tax=Rhynchophorus ferrugineus TaxID=354439 RepID=A0A834I693_RHYFE|nr:hypothetical protein GWI33_011877 [Rhynchophorus ferrugineus]